METLPPSCNIVGLQEVMQCEHADIRSRQEHQLEVTKQGYADIRSGQEVIKRGQEHQLLVTEHVLARFQGLEHGQKAISRQHETTGNY